MAKANITTLDGTTIVDFQDPTENWNYCEEVTVELNEERTSVTIKGVNVGWAYVREERYWDKDDKARVRDEYFEDYKTCFMERPISEIFKPSTIRRLKTGWVQMKPKPIHIVTTNFKIIYA
jgi:hypothetical protein